MNKLVTSVRTFKSLAGAIRSGNACIPITYLDEENHGVSPTCFGALVVEGDNSELRLRSSSVGTAEATSDGFDTYRKWNDAAKIMRCILDGQLTVDIKQISLNSSNRCSQSGTTSHHSFCEISMVGSGDNRDDEEEIEMISMIARSKLKYTNLIRSTKDTCSLEGEIGDRWKREGLGGDIPPYRYKIHQEEEDLLITIKLLKGEKSQSAESDQVFHSALITMFSWINDGHPYAYYRSHERDGKLIESVIQPLQRTPYCKSSVVHTSFGGSKAAEIIDCGIRFFQQKSTLTDDLRLFLWQYREATEEGSITLGMLLQGCTLLEGLVGLVLRHPLGLSERKINKLTTPFQGTDDKRQGHTEARFYHAGIHLGFNWDSEVEPVFVIWKKVRNALGHGNLGEFWNDMNHPVIDSYLKIIQAFNAMALRLIGYKGRVCMDDGWYAVPN